MPFLFVRRVPAACLVALLILALAPFAAAQTGSGTGSGTTGSGTTGSGTTGSGTTGSGTTGMLGYSPLSDTTAPTVNTFYSFTSSSNTAFIVPFQMNSLGSNFSLSSVSLLIDGTDSAINDMSVSVSDTLSTSFTSPTPLVTFTNSVTGWPGPASVAYTYSASTTPTLDANTTYYLRIGYTGPGTMNWDKTDGSAFTGSGGIPALTSITGTLTTGTTITYRQVNTSSYSDLYNVIGGFSITANAVSAIPEPAATGALMAGAALLAGLAVRWRRRRRSLSPSESDSDSAPGDS